jgi:4-hydroxy-3-polyprenylbenzoate decarboxylase
LDGGSFITLPQVYTEDVGRPGLAGSNLGMYRVQLTGNQYRTDEQIGLHYQIHRGIGVHHARAIERGVPLPVNIFVGGTPAMTLAAVMPLPEGMPELGFAGALAGHRIPMIRRREELPIYAQADFCISGYIEPDQLLPEGPFGDHLGYYSLTHPFPVLGVRHVYHRRGAIWPFTVVGRPPQEDTVFGQLIHELTSEAVPATIPGVRQVHAVDAAGVHPLLLAVGSERYVPFEATTEPQEILTQAHAILGQGQLSLAKFLWIAAGNDAPDLDVQDIPAFMRHVLARIHFTRDVHFHTCTTIDTLDYSGKSLNSGSKVVMAAAGKPCRELPTALPTEFQLPIGYGQPRLAMPGVLVIESRTQESVATFCRHFDGEHPLNTFPLIVLVDDSQFATASLNNFLWVSFTRCNPAADMDGIESFVDEKHWGCRGSLVIDARKKPHHAPLLEPDPDTCRRVDALAARRLPISRWL